MPKKAKALFIVVALGCFLLVGFDGSAEVLTRPAVKEQSKSVLYKQKMMKIKQLRRQIDKRRQATWQWQDTALANRTTSRFKERRVIGVPYLRWLHGLWARRAERSKDRAINPPHLALWLCIQSGVRGGKWDWLVHRQDGTRVGKGEASWFDDGSPYWGGLQMGRWFHETYGGSLYTRYGTANNWRPIQQIWVAERAFKREGYSVRWLLGQWPNTAPPCVSLLE